MNIANIAGQLLMFADDMVMMAETEEALQQKVEAMNEALVRWDLKVNGNKSKVMRVARKRDECQVRIGDEQLEQVDTMKYLGVMISDDGSMQREVEARVGCASRVTHQTGMPLLTHTNMLLYHLCRHTLLTRLVMNGLFQLSSKTATV